MAALQSSFAGAKVALPSAQPVRNAPVRRVVSPVAETRIIKQVRRRVLCQSGRGSTGSSGRYRVKYCGKNERASGVLPELLL